jgi:hypothetical protein
MVLLNPLARAEQLMLNFIKRGLRTLEFKELE